MKLAIGFSGGYDSTYLVWKLLTDTQEDITTITLYRDDSSEKTINNWFVPKQSSIIHIPKIISELQKIRPFVHINRKVDNAEITDENSAPAAFLVDQYVSDINSDKYDRIATGRSWEQWNEFQIPSKKGTLAEFAAQRLFDREATRGEFWLPLVTHDIHDEYCRWHVLSYLPENLQKLAISCTDPVTVDGEIHHCGECHKCTWDVKVRSMIAEGWNSQQVNTWKFLKGLQYGGGNNISAATRFWMPLEFGGKNILGLDTKEKVRQHTQKQRHHAVAWRKNEGIWKFY